MAADPVIPDDVVLKTLGERLARRRLSRNLTQDQLAREAGVSKRTLIRLEHGESTQLTNLIRVLRALDLLSNLDLLVPAPRPSPLAQLEVQRRERKRASPRSTGDAPETKRPWTWGDESDAKERET